MKISPLITVLGQCLKYIEFQKNIKKFELHLFICLANATAYTYEVSKTRNNNFEYMQVVQLSQRDRAAGWVSYGQKWKTDNMYGHYKSIFNLCDVIVQQSNRIRRKTQNLGLLRRSCSFEVIEIGINRKPICDFLLLINSN